MSDITEQLRMAARNRPGDEQLAAMLRHCAERCDEGRTVDGAWLRAAADCIETMHVELLHKADALEQARTAEAAWMNAVADAVESYGFDRSVACGPADLIPGLRQLVNDLRAERARANRLLSDLQKRNEENQSVNDDLVGRLRDEASLWDSFRGPSPTKELLLAGAEALEAARVENERLLTKLSQATRLSHLWRSQRDVEIGQADRLASALGELINCIPEFQATGNFGHPSTDRGTAYAAAVSRLAEYRAAREGQT